MATIGTACRDCGGPKPAGAGRKLCDACRSAASGRRLERRRDASRNYYRENRDRLVAKNCEWARNNADRMAEYQRAYHERDKASGNYLARNLRRYGLTVDDYEALLQAQGGVCAICGDTDTRRRLNVDHDHATGRVRGLLCNGCNTARLGKLGDSVERAEARAIYYEERARLLRCAIAYLHEPPAVRVLGVDR